MIWNVLRSSYNVSEQRGNMRPINCALFWLNCISFDCMIIQNNAVFVWKHIFEKQNGNKNDTAIKIENSKIVQCIREQRRIMQQ